MSSDGASGGHGARLFDSPDLEVIRVTITQGFFELHELALESKVREHDRALLSGEGHALQESQPAFLHKEGDNAGG